MLEVDAIKVSYGAAPALWDVSLALSEGELVCVVGPNGAGKTTLINAIAGLLPRGPRHFSTCASPGGPPDEVLTAACIQA